MAASACRVQRRPRRGPASALGRDDHERREPAIARRYSFGETYREANLPAPSIVRPCKLATIEGGDAEKIGRVNAEMMEEVVAFLRRAMLGG